MNRFLFRSISISFIGVLAACSMRAPHSVDEVRAYDSAWKDVESFTVKRPYKDVKASLVAQAKKCLNIRVDSSQNLGMGRGSVSEAWVYHPKIKATRSGATLSLQKDMVKGNLIGDVPPDGMYAFVLDVSPKTTNSTQVNFHWFSGLLWGTEHEAIMEWVKKGSTACPVI